MNKFGDLINRKFAIDHPRADTLSVSVGMGTYSDEDCSEIAFFKNDEWVTDLIPPFVSYADDMAGKSRVYCYVPDQMIKVFLEEHGVKGRVYEHAKEI